MWHQRTGIGSVPVNTLTKGGLMSRVSKREDVFYQAFKDYTKVAIKSGELFEQIIAGWPETKDLIPQTKELEHEGDAIVGSVLRELNVSFITPFDREDVEKLIRNLDQIVDYLEAAAVRFGLYDVNVMLEESSAMADLVLRAIRELDELFEHFPQFRKDPKVSECCSHIIELEDEGDVVYRDAIARIFAEHGDPIHILKWNDLLQKMENALDSCKDVANIVYGVIMKNA